MTMLLADDRQISNGRVWALRIVLGLLLISGVISGLGTRVEIASALGSVIGTVIGTLILYYIGLRLLSEDESAQQVAMD